MADICEENNGLIWEADYLLPRMTLLKHGFCTPASCSTPDLAEKALEILLHHNRDHLKARCEVQGCPVDVARWKPVNITQLAHWHELKLDFAIVAYPRCSTTALLYYLTESNHESVEFVLPGGNEVEENGRAMEDRFFGYDTGRLTFPTKQMVEDFNADHHRYNHTNQSKRKIITIKNPDYLSAWWSMLRMILVGDVKFLVMTCDAVRWFDYEIYRNVAYKAEAQGDLRFRNERVVMPMDLVLNEFNDVYDHVLHDHSSMLNLLSSMDFLIKSVGHTEYLVLHSDMFRENPDYALATLSIFLKIETLAPFPAVSKRKNRTAWRTDICSSQYYDVLKDKLTRNYDEVASIFFANRGIDPPARYISKISKCEEDLLN